MNPFELRHQLELRPLPGPVMPIIQALGPPPVLVAHLLVVHDVAAQLVAGLHLVWPSVPVDAEAICFGAATHDIGKTVHPEELFGGGEQHGPAGRDLLLEMGVAPELARFAATHSNWRALDGECLDDLLVILADNIWQGHREQALEDRIIAAGCNTREPWEAFMELDSLLQVLALDADKRLVWQTQFIEPDSEGEG